MTPVYTFYVVTMTDKWTSEVGLLISRDNSPQSVVVTLTKSELVARLPWVIGGLIFSFPATVAAGYLVSYIAHNYMQVFFLGFVPCLIGLGIIATQIMLIHEGIHHTVYKPPEWISQTRKWLLPLVFVITAYPLFFFLPMEDSFQIWGHPAIVFTDTLLVTLLGVTSTYYTKIGYDYFPLTDEMEHSIWKASLILIAMYYSLWSLLILILYPHFSLTKIGLRLSTTVISLFGVLYSIKGDIREQRHGSSLLENPNIDGLVHHYLMIIRNSKLLTFLAATLAGAWLPILAGAWTFAGMGLTPPPSGVQPGIFAFGYPSLLLYGWLLIFGPLVLGVLLSVLVTVATVAANGMQ